MPSATKAGAGYEDNPVVSPGSALRGKVRVCLNTLTGELLQNFVASFHRGIRIAHAIRDISYKKKSGISDLWALLKSKDPAYQSVFRNAYWID